MRVEWQPLPTRDRVQAGNLCPGVGTHVFFLSFRLRTLPVLAGLRAVCGGTVHRRPLPREVSTKRGDSSTRQDKTRQDTKKKAKQSKKHDWRG